MPWRQLIGPCVHPGRLCQALEQLCSLPASKAWICHSSSSHMLAIAPTAMGPVSGAPWHTACIAGMKTGPPDHHEWQHRVLPIPAAT